MASGDLSDVAFGLLTPASSAACVGGNAGRRENPEQQPRRAQNAEREDPELEDAISPSNDVVHELDRMA